MFALSSSSRKIAVVALVLGLGACAIVPTGPSQMALPGSKKTFDQFRADDANCRGMSMDAIGGRSASQASVDSSVATTVLGTAIGAIAGAAIGGSRGAGVGAAGGLLIGSSVAAGASDQSYRGTQRPYDQLYIQCMYAAGHRVPVSGRLMESLPQRAAIPAPPAGSPPPPPSASGIPAPPAGSPPPPPPNVPRG